MVSAKAKFYFQTVGNFSVPAKEPGLQWLLNASLTWIKLIMQCKSILGPYYHLLEAGGSQTYESPDDVIDEMKMLRNPSDKSENRYAPLQEHKTSVKENTYEPLTLDRNVKMPSDMDKDKNQGKELLCKALFSKSDS